MTTLSISFESAAAWLAEQLQLACDEGGATVVRGGSIEECLLDAHFDSDGTATIHLERAVELPEENWDYELLATFYKVDYTSVGKLIPLIAQYVEQGGNLTDFDGDSYF